MSLSIAYFAGAVCIHVILHRAFLRLSIRTVPSIVVYGVGLVALVLNGDFSPFPFTALWLYTLLVVAYLLYYLSYTHDAQSPSAKTLEVVQKYGPMTYAQILGRFTNEELIGMRLTRLVQSGWIAKRAGRLRVTGKGAAIAGFFTWYRTLLRWDDGG